jgi:cephalosporin hydroxylase
MASIFDLLDRGQVVTIDVRRMTDLTHPRVEFLVGSSVAPEIVEKVRAAREAAGATRTLLLLDSDHSAAHVLRELEIYAPMLDVGDPILVQDGCIDELPMLSRSRPGPLRAIEDFLAADPRFQVDEDRTGTFVMSHSPKGWLRRIA